MMAVRLSESIRPVRWHMFAIRSISGHEMAKPKPNDSWIRDYAVARGMHFQWRTFPDQGRWKAEVTLGHQGSPGCSWVGRGDTEQEALDQGMHYATSYYDAIRDAGKQHGTPPAGW